MTPIEHLSGLFGGDMKLAVAAGVHWSLVSRWKTRASETHIPGHIPSRYNGAILAAGKEAGIARRRIVPHLDTDVCPLCEGTGKAPTPQVARRFTEKINGRA